MKRPPRQPPSTPRRLIHFTPLRYPGGKGKLANYVKKIVERNGLSDCEYVEPYAGGAAIALELLLQEYVAHIHINDISRPIFAFWKSVLDHTEELTRLIHNTPITISSWDKQKSVFANSDDNDAVSLGFATFFLNRTNRSGIFNGGAIGGRDQSGPWKIDARYNVEELIFRIQTIANMRARISVTREDATSFIRQVVTRLPKNSLVFLDPPYYNKGKHLYYNFYTHDDHLNISNLIGKKIRKQKWVVSYDNVEAIREMYSGFRHIVYDIGYSARERRKAQEIMFFCDKLEIPPLVGAMQPAC